MSFDETAVYKCPLHQCQCLTQNGVEQPNTWLAVFSNWLRAPVTSPEFESAASPARTGTVHHTRLSGTRAVPPRAPDDVGEVGLGYDKAAKTTETLHGAPITAREMRRNKRKRPVKGFTMGGMKYDVRCSMSPAQNKGFRALLFPNFFRN